MAEHFDHFGIKKGQHGRIAFSACKEAARVDPKNLAARTAYGKALLKISRKRMKDRIASFLKIDLRAEADVTARALRELIATAISPDGPRTSMIDDAKRTLAELDALLQSTNQSEK